MNDPVIIRAHGLGGGRSLEAPARRGVEREHLAFVEAHKHRMSWQAMAKACGVNQHDLRRACDRAYAGGDAPPPATAEVGKPVGSANSRPVIPPLKVLRAIHKGARSREDLADLLSVAPGGLTRPITFLRQTGWLAGNAGAYSGWVVTNAGLQALRRPEGSDDE